MNSKFIPNSFIIPNSVVDELMAEMSGVELKCYLFVIRKTKGWNKEYDAISLTQFVKFTGAGKTAVIDALKNLVDLGLLVKKTGVRNTSVYAINSFGNQTSSESELVQKANSTSSESELVTSSESEHTKNNNINTTTKNKNTSSSEKNFQTEQRAKKYSFSPDDMRAAEWIFELLKKLNPEFKVKSMDSWANCVRLMRERDGRTHRDICELFQWANQDPFWSLNILSPSSLREKWIQLSIKKQASERKPHRTTFQERNSTNWGTPEKMAEVF